MYKSVRFIPNAFHSVFLIIKVPFFLSQFLNVLVFAPSYLPSYQSFLYLLASIMSWYDVHLLLYFFFFFIILSSFAFIPNTCSCLHLLFLAFLFLHDLPGYILFLFQFASSLSMYAIRWLFSEWCKWLKSDVFVDSEKGSYVGTCYLIMGMTIVRLRYLMVTLNSMMDREALKDCHKIWKGPRLETFIFSIVTMCPFVSFLCLKSD